MTNICAVFWKQIKDTFKNKTTLIQFVMFPVLTIIMENAVTIENMPEHFFVKLFAVMFVGMAPLTSMSAIISEEKEKHTLRVLLMSNVRPFQYLIGIGAYVWLLCMMGAAVFAACGGYEGMQLFWFLLIMAAGILLSLLTGAVIGICCKNQMSATSLSVPVMMVFSFLPMLAMFNATIEKIAEITYSQQIYLLINQIGSGGDVMRNCIVLSLNALVGVSLFFWAYGRKGLE